MATATVWVEFPSDLIAEIDEVAGQQGRQAYLLDLARKDLVRQKQKAALLEAAGSWTPADHPELARGSEAFIRSLREQTSLRTADLDARRNPGEWER